MTPGAKRVVGHRDYAPWLLRVGAYLVDGIVAWVASIVLFWLVDAVGGFDGSTADTNRLVVTMLFVAVSVAVFGWRQGTTGQTPGKALLGAEVIRNATDDVLGGPRGVARMLLAIVNSLPLYLGWLWPLWDEKRQTFADKVTDAVVIRTQRRRTFWPGHPQQDRLGTPSGAVDSAQPPAAAQSAQQVMDDAWRDFAPREDPFWSQD